jgi:hypothetical protein
MPPGELIPILAILAGVVIAVVSVVSCQWRMVRVAELEAALKQDMLQRGMQAEEIERVIFAARSLEHGRGRHHRCGRGHMGRAGFPPGRDASYRG